MTTERWELTKVIFEQALELAGEPRASFIEHACGQDDEVRREVLHLLEQNDRAGNFLDDPIGQGIAALGLDRTFRDGQLVLNRFRIVRLLGSGGMGEVYEADDQELRARVALKTIRSDVWRNPELSERFRQEIQLARKVTHDNVCRVFDLFTVPGNGRDVSFLTMEFLPGVTLSKRLRDGPRFQMEQAAAIAVQLCDGLAAAHHAGVIHRDFKSPNVMLVPGANGATRAIITDFGLARTAEPEDNASTALTRPGQIMGTPAYMAPEQLEGGPIGPVADIYALGVVLYEMATGRTPFISDSPFAAALQRLKQPAPSPQLHAPGLDPRWEKAILKCLEYDPARRYQSACDVQAALTGSLPQPRTSSSAVRKRVTLAAASLLVISTVAIGFLLRGPVTRGMSRVPAEKHLAVIPFRNIGNDASSEVFCDGVVETLTSKLSQLERFQKSFWVVPASEVRKVKNLDDAERALGVTLVVTGSMHKVGNTLRVIANLSDAHSRKLLASRTVDVTEEELPGLEDRVWERVADMLDLQIPSEARRTLDQGGTKVPGAYEYYEQGVGYAQRFTITDLDNSIGLFQKALSKDPLYALAYAGLADAYSKKFFFNKEPALIELARQNAQHALDLNSKLTPVLLIVAALQSRTGHKEEATRYWKKALELDPASAEATIGLAKNHDDLGRVSEAESAYKCRLDSPRILGDLHRARVFYYRHGKYAKAEPLFRTAIGLAPDNPVGYENLGGTFLQMGQYDQAVSILKKSLSLRETAPVLSNLASAYMYQQRFDDAVPLLERAVKLTPMNHLLWRNLGDAYEWSTNERGEANAAYRRALEMAYAQLKINPDDPSTLASAALYSAKLGQAGEARKLIGKAMSKNRSSGDLIFKSALIYELAGDRRGALDAVQSAWKTGYSLEQIRKEPELTILRSDPRFQSWLKQVMAAKSL